MSLQQAITEFRGQFRGAVIEPEDAAYHEARKVYNAMIDRKPRLIAKCTDAADVMAAVRMAKTNGLRVSIRGGRVSKAVVDELRGITAGGLDDLEWPVVHGNLDVTAIVPALDFVPLPERERRLAGIHPGQRHGES